MSRIYTARLSNRMGSLSADKINTHLKSMIVLTTSGVANTALTWSMNDLFDPFLANSTIQPIGFDQLTNIYNKYQVHASRITIKLVNLTTTGGVWVSIFPSAINTNALSFTGATEQPYSKYCIIGVATGQDVGLLKNYCSCSKVVGRIIKYDQNFAGTATSNPGTQLYWQFNMSHLDGVSNINVQYLIEIMYYCEFWARVQIDNS